MHNIKHLVLLIAQFFFQVVLHDRQLTMSFIFIHKVMRSAWQQWWAILYKNYTLYWRKHIFLYDLINISVILAIVFTNQYSHGLSQIPLAIYLCLALLMHCRNTVLAWVSQKEKQHRDKQTVMGTSGFVYISAWITYFYTNGIAISTVFALLLRASNFYSDWGISVGHMIGLLVLFMLASVNFCLMLSTFFSDTNLACQTITLIHIIFSFFYNIISLSAQGHAKVVVGFASVFPTLSFEYTLTSYSKYNFIYSQIVPYSISQGLTTLCLQGTIYFIFFLYFEAVLPRKNGSNYHPLFFIKYFTKIKQKPTELQEGFELSNISSARFHQPNIDNKKVAIVIKELCMSFNKKQVVKNLSMSLFEGQVLCLLGHNGAGKSTTLNMLSNLLKPQSGTIVRVQEECQHRQVTTGICMQSSVLYRDLKVKEHIKFYAKLKGVNPEDIEREVTQIMQKCTVIAEKDTYIKHLSGGNERKTSLACAAVGGSTLVFLDEPTSRLDPQSRRQVWELIRLFKRQGRTVVLTTQHLDEAQALADRVGMLAQGQLVVLGSTHYIKERFSCGYHLTVTLAEHLPFNAQKRIIRQQVNRLIPGATQDQQSGEDGMKFMLPFSQQQNFSSLFKIFQEDGITFSIALSSIQDIFIKFGTDPDAMFDNEPLSVIQPPPMPDEQPGYCFLSQFKGVFMVKFRTTVRSVSQVACYILLSVYLTLGIILSISLQFPHIKEFNYFIVLTAFYQHFKLAYYLCLVYSFGTAQYCYNMVKERQNKWKYVSLVMGLSKKAYWTATIFFDFILLSIPFWITFIVLASYSRSANSSVHAFGWLAVTAFLFTLCFLTFSYMLSYTFSRSSTAYHFFPYVIFLFFFLIPLIPCDLAPVSPVLQWIFPTVSPLMGLACVILSQQFIGQPTYNDMTQGKFKDMLFACGTITYPLITLTIQTIVFFIITLTLEHFHLKLKDKEIITTKDIDYNQTPDLIQQKKSISQAEQQAPLVVDGLYKKYPTGKIAVRDNSFMVKKGEVFGLLGPNGAGKSTTFNILTAALSKTEGQVRLKGREVTLSDNQLFTQVGICPQVNPIYDELTVEEHIDYMALIKGLDDDKRKEVIDFYTASLHLEPQRKKRAGELSEGNRRKVCVAMALVGSPDILLLDEASSSMDPISRQYLWDIIHSTNNSHPKSIILTTHSISEAESLCDRIGVLLAGQLHSIASTRTLKNRHAHGYRVALRCSSIESLDKAKQRIEIVYPQCICETDESELKMYCQFSHKGLKFSQLFELLSDQLKGQEIIEQFQVQQTTLQEVFLRLVNRQQATTKHRRTTEITAAFEVINNDPEKDELLHEKAAMVSRISDLQQKVALLERTIQERDEEQASTSLFAGGVIFSNDDSQQRAYLIDTVKQHLPSFTHTILLYRMLPHNTSLVGHYLSQQKNTILIVKSGAGKLTAIFSANSVDSSIQGQQMMMSLWQMQTSVIRFGSIDFIDGKVVYRNCETVIDLVNKRIIIDNNETLRAPHQTQERYSDRFQEELQSNGETINCLEVYQLASLDESDL